MIELERRVPNTINDRYRVLELLGRGGMGQVFLVEDTQREGCRMALKTLLPKTTDRLLTSGFRDEFAELAKLEHPHLARAYDFGRVQGTDEHFFTTEFVQGVDLMEAARDATLQQTLDMFAQVLRALDFIHNHGILHNDLKPANILLESEGAAGDRGDLERLESVVYGRTGRVKLIDFGLISREHTAWDKILGTLRYISPERVRREAADRRSDLYSIGAVFYTLLARRPPFGLDKDPRRLLQRHLHTTPRRLDELRPDLPAGVVELVHRLLEKRPDDRFASGAEALDHLASEAGWKEETGDGPANVRWREGRLAAGALLHREAELGTLRELLHGAAESAAGSRAVIVEGPPGTGKTRLVDELRGEVQVAGGAFAAVDCAHSVSTLEAVVGALVGGFQTCGAPEAETVRKRLDACGSEDGPAPRHVLEQIVLDFTSHRLLVLHFDDYERAPAAIRDLLVELVHSAANRVREGVPCRLLIIVGRESAEAGGDVAFGDLPVLHLEAFSPEQSESFVRDVFGQTDIPPAVLETIVKSAEGNPLFLLELANRLVESGRVTFSGSGWTFPEDLEGVDLPESLDRLLGTKIASLSPLRQELLQWIAIAERPVPRRVLARCLRGRLEDFDALVADLVRLNLVTESTTEEGIDELRLANSAYRPLALEGTGDGRRAQLHQRLAQNTEEEFPDRTDLADVLAAHWLAAGNEAGFLRFAPDAAETLRRRGDFPTAVAYHKRIADAVPESAVAKKVRSISKLSEMHEFLWDLEACRNDLDTIRQLGERLMKPFDRGLLARRIACVELARFRWEDALAFLDEAKQLLATASGPLRAAVEAPRALALWFSGRTEDATALLDATEAQLAGTPPASGTKEGMLRTAAFNHLAALCHTTGRLERCVSLLSRNLEALGDRKRDQALGATRCALGSVLLDLGRHDEGLDHLRGALQTGKETGDRRTLCRARERLGEHWFHCGQYRQALQTTQVALADARGIRSRGAVAASLRTLGRIYVHAGDPDAAHHTLKKAVSVSAECGDLVNRALCRLRLAEFAIARGEHEVAEEQLRTGSEETQRLRLPRLEGLSLLLRARLAWKARGDERTDLLATARERFASCGYHAELLEVVRAEAETAVDRGRNTALKERLAELRELTDDHRRPDLTCEANWLLAQAYARSGERDRASAFVRRVRDQARAQDKLGIVRRSEKLLEELEGVPA